MLSGVGVETDVMDGIKEGTAVILSAPTVIDGFLASVAAAAMHPLKKIATPKGTKN
jgi:hypothetical protein